MSSNTSNRSGSIVLLLILALIVAVSPNIIATMRNNSAPVAQPISTMLYANENPTAMVIVSTQQAAPTQAQIVQPQPTQTAAYTLQELATAISYQELIKTCVDATLYLSPSLDDKAPAPYSYFPKGLPLPIANQYGDWSLIAKAVYARDVWILTSDLEDKNGQCN